MAYKEGTEGLMIYFILVDASGAMTTSDGKVTLTISEITPLGTEDELYSMSFNVKKTDFRKRRSGSAHSSMK